MKHLGACVDFMVPVKFNFPNYSNCAIGDQYLIFYSILFVIMVQLSVKGHLKNQLLTL